MSRKENNKTNLHMIILAYSVDTILIFSKGKRLKNDQITGLQITRSGSVPVSEVSAI